MKKTPLETTAEYNRPSGAVRTQEGRRIESGRSVGRHEWSIGKRGSGMTQDVLGALPGRGSRAGRALLRWINASRLMRRKTSTDIVNVFSLYVQYLYAKRRSQVGVLIRRS